MSYTIVKDEEYYNRQTENRLNAVVRHCKIGKVSPKPASVWPLGVGRPALPKDTFFIPPYDPWVPSIYAPNTGGFNA